MEGASKNSPLPINLQRHVYHPLGAADEQDFLTLEKAIQARVLSKFYSFCLEQDEHIRDTIPDNEGARGQRQGAHEPARDQRGIPESAKVVETVHEVRSKLVCVVPLVIPRGQTSVSK